MKSRRILLYLVVLAVLAVLVYFQFRSWRNFDWQTFLEQTGSVNKLDILAGLALIYLAYGLRAVRWAIFLRPVRKIAAHDLLTPTIIGFSGLALLGRAAEPVRPYLIARKVKLPFSSQLAVWAVERIFDIGGFAVVLLAAIFLASAPKQLAYYSRFREGGFVIVGLVAALTVGTLVTSWKGEAVADWFGTVFSHSNFGGHVALRIREFRSGLNTIHSASSLAQLIAVSVAMWSVIALAYWEILRSYGPGPLQRPLSVVPLLMASSMVGSMIQLPAVGGGSQLATIGTLQYVFAANHEVAASCGILLWLVTMVSIAPVGLMLAHRQRISLQRLSEESQQAETVAIS